MTVVIVSGGTYGIGRAVTLLLAERGYSVIAFGINSKQPGSAAHNGVAETRELIDRLKLTAAVLEADVTDAADIARVVKHAVAHYGRVDGLVNNAAIRIPGTVLETTPGDLDASYAVNVRGPFLCARHVLPHMLKARRGSIVNIGSGSGWGAAGLATYCATKAGIHGLSQAIALDYGAHGIRSNLVIPGGGIRTGMTVESGRFRPGSGEREMVPASDVAEVVEFLLSSRAASVNGAIFDVGVPSVRMRNVPSRALTAPSRTAAP